MTTISFITANYVARQVEYHMTQGWGQGDQAANEYFKPIETFAPRFEEILRDIRALGFEAIDLWLSHLNFNWATQEHIEIARKLLNRFNLQVVSLGGWFGANLQEFEACCKIAVALNTEILGGSTSAYEKDRASVIAMLQDYHLKLGLENHPEKTPEVMLQKIGDGGDGAIGATVDTGWFGTQGYDAAEAIQRLREHIFHVHLKDVLHVGEPHETCRYGLGIVPIEKCVRALQEIGYRGAITIEHEPELFDPTEDIKAEFAMVREWLRY